jgi:phytol kinase
MLSSNILALIITFIVALAWLRFNDFLAHRGWVDSHLSRKFIHIGTGPLFVLCWLLFNTNPVNKYLAALVPLAFTLQFLLIGIGIIKDEASVRAMSRSGDRREILRGPLYYGIIFVFLTIIYWKSSPVGIIALMLMCGGDGVAEIVGRRWGRVRNPLNKRKSLVGSAGMLVGGWVFSVVIVWIFVQAEVFPAPIQSYLLPISVLAVVGTLVEALPFKDIDNLTITLSAMILGYFLF